MKKVKTRSAAELALKNLETCSRYFQKVSRYRYLNRSVLFLYKVVFSKSISRVDPANQDTAFLSHHWMFIIRLMNNHIACCTMNWTRVILAQPGLTCQHMVSLMGSMSMARIEIVWSYQHKANQKSITTIWCP